MNVGVLEWGLSQMMPWGTPNPFAWILNFYFCLFSLPSHTINTTDLKLFYDMRDFYSKSGVLESGSSSHLALELEKLEMDVHILLDYF